MLYYRRKILLALIEAFGGYLAPIPLQKYLFLFTRNQADKAYDFIPYYYGCFSFQANHDLAALEKMGYLEVLKEGDNQRIHLVKPGNYLSTLDMFDQQAITRIRADFGGLSQDELIHYTYAKYPYYAINSTIAKKLMSEEELAEIGKQKRCTTGSALFTIGYEGKTLERYINQLICNDVHVLCDVRKNAFSMKYGFSKKQLEKACEGVGIQYIHVPQLGIESNQRQELHTQDDYDRLFDAYEHTTLRENWNYLLHVRHLIDKCQRVALTCFEANPNQCHRTRVAKYLMTLPETKYPLTHL